MALVLQRRKQDKGSFRYSRAIAFRIPPSLKAETPGAPAKPRKCLRPSACTGPKSAAEQKSKQVLFSSRVLLCQTQFLSYLRRLHALPPEEPKRPAFQGCAPSQGLGPARRRSIHATG